MAEYERQYIPNTDPPEEVPVGCTATGIVNDPIVPIAEPGVIITTDDFLGSSFTVGGGTAFQPTAVESFQAYKPHDMEIQLDPIKTAMAPINLPGRTVVDLSVSGSSFNPLAFSMQELAMGENGENLNVELTNQEVHGIMVMFNADGSVEGIYKDQWNGSSFDWVRFPPQPSMSFLVGPSSGVRADSLAEVHLQSLDDNPSDIPNFANSDCFLGNGP